MRISTATVLLVLGSLGAQGCFKPKPPGHPAQHPQQLPNASEDRVFLGAWADSPYNFCDANVLASYWASSVEQAKISAGMKLKAGMGLKVFEKTLLQPARLQASQQNTVRCSFYDNGYTPADAQVLAELWGGTVEDAKGRAERKLLWGDQWVLDDELKSAYNGGYDTEGHEEGVGGDAESQAANAFWDSPMNYCDAELLATFWETSLWEAKVTLGFKVQAGYTQQDISDLVLWDAFQAAEYGQQVCHYAESPYSYDDAIALGQFWGVPLEESKLMISQKVMVGGQQYLDSDLTQARALKR